MPQLIVDYHSEHLPKISLDLLQAEEEEDEEEEGRVAGGI